MSRRNTNFMYILLALVLCLTQLPSTMFAASATNSTNNSTTPIDAVLVLDASNSMKSSDPQQLGSEAMKLFIDMLPSQGDRVGVVSYTDRIEREKALTAIQSADDKTQLKSFIDGLTRGAYTDISVGMKEAVNILQDNAQQGHEPMIVLFADGNNQLNSNSGRSNSDADNDLNTAVAQAKKDGYPVYTIGLNADGKLNQEALKKIADDTGGKSFVTTSAQDLPEILSEIFADHQEVNVVPVDSITGNGQFQDVKIHIPNANVKEANISIMSSEAVEVKLVDPSGNAVAVPSDKVSMSTSKSYSLVKLLSPEQGDWTLQVKGVDQDKIDINLVFNYNLELALDPIPTKAYSKGDKIDIVSYLTSGGQKLTDNSQASSMKAVLNVKDMDTGTTSQVPLTTDGSEFKGTFEVPDNHVYQLVARAEEQSFYRETAPVTIDAKGGVSGSGEKAGLGLVTWIIIAVVALLILAGLWFLLGFLKKRNRGFVGQMVIEIRDENTGERSYPQYKKLTTFRGKFNLHQLVQLAPELKETENIIFTPSSNDRIMIRNNADNVIEKSARAIDASKGFELKSGDRITISLRQVDKTIMLEYLT
ncbi:Ca-activated chloride channel family protein [Paenibacillus sp. SORGH_AS306]|uniref:vWA domain-containing protein n=1 Tax=unclassified Paenibacillus TaxID=185978 RepID=UPI0023657141|nr:MULTISPECIES: vWA domain-containing protein [unclassified Paenibacillus]MDQ1236888.1 Ca-activated chloride channel family protein [Paenibacillus sp. SORGH_AS_0306]MDR6109250.1 Ca-activated chloride channel family protein [Paenibacillus sp. SORGH_AS_0338]WDF50612.1 VWA domain-containing protein [Paenibacillus sp. KACC 21273]